MHVLHAAACAMAIACASDALAQDLVLVPAGEYTTGDWSPAVVLGDFDNDGVPDAAATGPESEPGVLLFRGTGTGGFETPVRHPLGAAERLHAIDLDNDGRLDLHVSSGSAGQALLGDGLGGFRTTIASPSAEAVGDFTGDGTVDLVGMRPSQTCAACQALTLYRGRGDGTFGTPETIGLTDDFFVGVVAADFDGDGTLDLAFDNPVQRALFIALNDGGGAFGVPQRQGLTAITQPHVAAGDTNGDGAIDLVLTNPDGTVSLFVGNGDGTTQPPHTVSACQGGPCADPLGVAIADLDGDGLGDVITTPEPWVAVLAGRSDGTLAPPVLFPASDFAWQPVPAEVTGDGRIDLVVSSGDSADRVGARGFFVYVNQSDITPPPPPPPPPPPGGDVTWTDTAHVTISGDVVTKSGGCDGCFDAIATAAPSLTPEGSVEFTVVDPTRIFAAGLTATPGALSPSALEFAFYVQGGGWVEVRESGAYRTDTRVAAGDRLRITLGNEGVVYAINDTPFYTGGPPPTSPLVFQAQLAHRGASIAEVSLTSGTSPPPPPDGPNPVVWGQSANVAIVDGSVRKVDGCDGCFDAFAVADPAIVGGAGSVAFTVTDPSRLLVAGLAARFEGTTPAGVDYGIFIQGGGWAEVREAGAYRADVPIAAGDVIRIEAVDGEIRYARNDVVFYTSTVPNLDPLMFVVLLATPGAELSNVAIDQAR